MRNWQRLQRLGFSVKSVAELVRTLELGANLVEIKLEKFATSGYPLYFYESGEFRPNCEALGLLALATKRRASVQFHLPIEKLPTLDRETGINLGLTEHHETALRRLLFLEGLLRRFELGAVITVHPPPYSLDGRQLIEPEVALNNSRLFFEKLDQLRLKEKHRTLIGVENQPDPKRQATCLGYLPSHFREMLKNTRTIGLTIDTGHRRLTKAFTVREFLGLGIPPVNFHFHGNAGEFSAENYDDDQHALPDVSNVKGYRNYLRYFQRYRPPVVLEISHLERYTDEELRRFLEKFRQELA